jgi:putative membrane protein
MLPALGSAALLGAVAFAGTPATALAQSTATASLSNSDSAFMMKTGQGSAYEAALSELGIERATSPMVREYAQALALDHATYNVGLLNLANRYRVVIPVQLDPSDTKRLDGLMKVSASGFDAAFLAEEARVNAADIADESKEIDSTQVAEIKTFVSDVQTGDRFHLSLAQNLTHGSTAASS